MKKNIEVESFRKNAVRTLAKNTARNGGNGAPASNSFF